MNKPLLNIPQPPNNFKLLPTQDYNPVYQDQPTEEQLIKENKIKNKASGQIFRVVFLSTLFFVLLSQPVLYKITHKISHYIVTTPLNLINSEGLPTTIGILVHGAIFFIILLFVAYS